MTGGCGYQRPGEDQCGAPPIMHFLVPPGTGGAQHWTAILACPTHEERARGYSVDEHTVGPICPSPRAFWAERLPKGESFCTLPEEDASIHEEAARAARVLEDAR